jgi:ATP-dependent helicase HrpA
MPSQSGAPPITDVRARLGDLTLRDERRLQRRLDGVRRIGEPAKRDAAVAQIAADVEAAQRRVADRRAAVPRITYPPALPVTAARERLLDALREAQVVVVAGETGSGKTTQLPKLCLELGRGVRGLIGHTQPRRLAARTVAERIADELGVTLGEQVGYQVRFTDQVSDRTLVKLMTDGILLAEIQRDPRLTAYDTLILDEAHERSLNIDFLLGYLTQLLPRRPDLKLVLTSATIDPQRFSRHFGGAPIVEVSGRTYPVEVRYRPLTDDDEGEDRDQIAAVCDAVAELCREGPGDVLVFLSGEREIRDTADALRGMDLGDTEVLPLYARLSAAEQQRVFAPHTGRRIVLATNVAETSLTVPGIRYVVDPGTARISRYSNRTKVQRLPIEPISQASANQRKGRCGRVAEGVCIRLYSEEDFEARPAFTEPEILRTNLASVILQMTALGLGDVEAFPFVDPPDRRSVRDAVQVLHELGALDDDRLTPVGRTLARLPVDPRLARMVVEGDRNGCLREVLVVVAALSIQDPRERPPEHEHAADEAHARFADERSDFLAYLNLWEYLKTQQRELSSNQFRRRCRAEFLHYLRVREWQDLHAQLRAVAKDAGMALNHTPAEADAVHRALLAGLLSHVGLKQGETREYLGGRGARLTLWPGSALARKPPAWVMAGELVETSRLWARTVARIEPEWAEQLAGHLVTRTYSEPHWEANRGAAVAYEKVTLYGVPLVAARTVTYSRIDPETSRELFLRHALVAGEWRTHHAFVRDNRRVLDELSELEHRARRRDLVVDDETLFAFYDARIPADVVSARHFDAWWKRARKEQPDLLTFTRASLLEGAAGVSETDYPGEWPQGDLRLRVSYRFAPGDPNDGVTVHVPLAVLNRVEAGGFDWQVPGLRDELVTALLRALPKDLRRDLGPVPDVVRALLPRLQPAAAPLTNALARELRVLRGVAIPRDAWDLGRVPAHLRITFRVVDGERTIAQGKNLAELQRRCAAEVRAAVADAADGLERRGLQAWTIGSLPRSVERRLDGHVVQGFPALVDEGDAAGVRVLLSEQEQRRAMWEGTRRLLLLQLPPPVKAVHARLTNAAKLVLTRAPHGSVLALLTDCTACAVDALLADHGGPAWDEEGFAKLRAAVGVALEPAVVDIVGEVVDVLAAWHDVESALGALRFDAPLDDVRAQLSGLVSPGFVTVTGRRRLPDLVRYLRAVERRLEKLPADPGRDAALAARVEQVLQEYEQLLQRVRPGAADEDVREIRWMIEELRVSLFAQQLGTRYPVSEQRILRAIDAAAGRR